LERFHQTGGPAISVVTLTVDVSDGSGVGLALGFDDGDVQGTQSRPMT
jgi:hypothetical protein